MNCERVEPLLSEQLEGFVSEREARAVQAHLGQCSACRRRREEFAAIRSGLRALAQQLPLPDSDIDRRAIDRWMAERATRSSGLKPRSVPAKPAFMGWAAGRCLAGAVAAVLLAVLAVHWRGHGPVTRPQRSVVATRQQPSPVAPVHGPFPEARKHGMRRQIVSAHQVPPGEAERDRRNPIVVLPTAHRRSGRNNPSLTPRLLPRGPVGDDMAYVNGDSLRESRRWVTLRPDERARIEAKIRHDVRVRDDFITIPFPLLASTSARQIAEAVESYKREAAITDPRLVREVPCAFKATALSDLCSQLRSDTGIELTAGPGVADEKVTVFCEKLPLREVMRQLSRPFGYTWLRRGTAGQYRYELDQDLPSQLQEEELRNRDRDQALIALNREMEGYQPYLALSPDEAQARAQTAAPEEKQLLEKLAGTGWGPIHMYFRLSPQELAALRAGGTVTFSADPKPGEQPLPPDVARTVLQSLRVSRAGMNPFAGNENPGSGPVRFQGIVQSTSTGGAPPSPDDPDAQAQVRLSLSRSELGRFTLSGLSGVATSGGSMMTGAGPYAVGTSPAATQPDHSAVDAQLAADPALRRRISVQPKAHWWESPFRGPGEPPAFGALAGGGPHQMEGPDAGGQPGPHAIGEGALAAGGPRQLEAVPTGADESPQSKIQNPKSKMGRVNSADVLEALHLATGLPIVADFYTHLYSPEAVSVADQPIFTALNHLAGAMRLRWDKEGKWLQFRSASFYNDRLKEVPNRLLVRWSAARRQSARSAPGAGPDNAPSAPPAPALPLEQFLEMAQLSDAQLDAADMAEGIRVCWELPEWDLARSAPARPQLRFLAGFTEPQLREAMGPAGLAFTQMPLAQQQQFLSLGFGGGASPPLEALAGASLHLEYLQPGEFRWTPTPAGPDGAGPRFGALGGRRPGPPPTSARPPGADFGSGSQAPEGMNAWRWLPGLSPIVAPARQDALQAARRLDPQAQPFQIMPTDLSVTLVYVWGNPKTGGMACIHRLAASQGEMGMMQTRQPLPPIRDTEPAATPR